MFNIKNRRSKWYKNENIERKQIINEIFKQKYNQDLPFVAEKINNYAIELEIKERQLLLKRKEEKNHQKRKRIEKSLYNGKIEYPLMICSIS